MRREGNVDQKDKELFDSIAKKYLVKDEVRSCSIPREFILFQAISPLLSDGKCDHTIIDIACGAGAPSKYLRGKYRKYIGIDHSSQMVALAREKHKDQDNVFFYSSNIKDPINTGDKADIVLALGALHHMTEYDRVFDSIRKNVLPGAYFCAVEPYGGNPIIGFLRKIRVKIDKGYSSDQCFFKKNEIIQILKDNGLSDIEIIHQGFFSPPFAQVVIKPQFITSILAIIAVKLDSIIERYFNWLLGPLSWNLIIRAKFK